MSLRYLFESQEVIAENTEIAGIANNECESLSLIGSKCYLERFTVRTIGDNAADTAGNNA